MDISGFLEVKERGKNYWTLKEYLPSARHYNIFGLLSDYRNELKIPPISFPRGLPINYCIKGQELMDKSDSILGSSHLYWEDFEKYDFAQKLPIITGTLSLGKTGKLRISDYFTPFQIIYKCGWDTFLVTMKYFAITHGAKRVRIVFWYY